MRGQNAHSRNLRVFIEEEQTRIGTTTMAPFPSNVLQSFDGLHQRDASVPEMHRESDATFAGSGVVIALAVVSVGLRFYTRIFTRSGLHSDDWLILAAVAFALATAAILLAGTQILLIPLTEPLTNPQGNSINPKGAWVSENTDTSYTYTPLDVFYLKLSFATSVFYFTIAGTTKLGILLMYNRIFNVNNAFRYQLYCACFLVAGWWIGCTVATLTNCIPLKWSWINSLADPRYCFNYNDFWMASGACEIGLDVLILVMPVSVVVRMKMSTTKKVTVLAIFLLSALYVFLSPPPPPFQTSKNRRKEKELWLIGVSSTIVTGVVRVKLGYPKASRVPSYSKTEIWTTVHAGMSIVCASLPIFRPLVRRMVESAFVSRISSVFSSKKSGDSSMGSRSWKKHSPMSSMNDSVMSFVYIQIPDPVFKKLPLIRIEEWHSSLSAQWEGFLEETKRKCKDEETATTYHAF